MRVSERRSRVSFLVAEQGDLVRRITEQPGADECAGTPGGRRPDGSHGMALGRAIAKGEWEARGSAKLRDPRCHKSEDEMAGQLTGHWGGGRSLQRGASPKDSRGHQRGS